MSRMNEGNGPKSGATSVAQVGQAVKDAAGNVRDAAQEKFQNLRETAGEYYEEGRERAMKWEHNVEDYVREQPIKSLLLAAGVGLLLGVFWRRS